VCGCCDELASSPISIIELKCCTSLAVKYGVTGVCGAVEVDPDTRAEGAGDRCAAEGATICEFPAKAIINIILSVVTGSESFKNYIKKQKLD
jgi:hypothetical protein